MEWYKWFSDKFSNMLRERKLFINLFNEQFGPGEIVVKNLQSGVPFDVRKTLLCGPMEEVIFNELLKRSTKSGGVGILETDSLDSKACKVRDWVNKNLTYVSDYANYGRPEMWATAYTIYDRKKDDCDGYAVLMMVLMKLAGIPADKRIIVVGEVDSGEYHAYVCYFSDDYQDWFSMEGSYLASESKSKFNRVPYIRDVRYKTPEWMFNEDNAWTVKGKEIFINKLK